MAEMVPKSEEIQWRDIKKNYLVQAQIKVRPNLATLGRVHRETFEGILLNPYLVISYESMRSDQLGFHNAIYMLSVIPVRTEGHGCLINPNGLDSRYRIYRWRYDKKPSKLIHPSQLANLRDSLLYRPDFDDFLKASQSLKFASNSEKEQVREAYNQRLKATLDILYKVAPSLKPQEERE